MNMFGLNIASVSFAEAVSALSEVLDKEAPAKVVVTPNTDQIVKLSRDHDLLLQYQTADFIFPDGFPLVVASHLLHGKGGCQERVTGADLFPALCRVVDKQHGRIFLLGGHPEDEASLSLAMINKYPSAQIEIFSPSMNFTTDSAEGRDAIERINRFKPDLTFACLGMPKQERWALRYRSMLATKLICCFGAAFEFDLGLTKRAPVAIQKIGLEWLWRLLGNPRALSRRYLIDDPYFAVILLRELLKTARHRRNEPRI
ncbi:MAG: WecB/TagA/CpsF family glycosyltransferase [Proteobacteria bacterium]|nr:WecB/TagA/CpsF family glycosyltransferase [Pseudomonadota bacterium]